MKTVEFWNWWLIDPAHAKPKPRKSRWKMSAEEAASYPGATRVEGTMELREVYEAGEAPVGSGMGWGPAKPPR